ncbi:uncharacterized protein [Nicotiana tomentosiformis]|uniref:uncharacterized protein n=1 Tax=Nicotiana tomentosiformis TaxID=4098 RepID=UPI00388C6F9B
MTTSTEQHNSFVGTITAAMAIASSSRTTPAPVMAPAEKPVKFSGMDFMCLQQKIFFYLTTLILQRFISEDVPVLGEETPEMSDLWSRSFLEDGLYNVYSVMKISQELWNALEKKYKTEDDGHKMFVAARYLDFKMVDAISVITQVQELQVIVHDLLAEGVDINEAFQVAVFIENMPPLWKDFKNYLKYKRKEMIIEDPIIHLRIEEDNKVAEKKSRGNSTIMGENIVEEESTSNIKRKKSSGPKNYPSKKKFKG